MKNYKKRIEKLEEKHQTQHLTIGDLWKVEGDPEQEILARLNRIAERSETFEHPDESASQISIEEAATALRSLLQARIADVKATLKAPIDPQWLRIHRRQD